jgi:hypothetical protein
MKLLHS